MPQNRDKPFFNQLLQGTSSLLILFLILAGNYEGFIFSCEFRKKLLNSVWMKHLIGFGILYVFVVQFAMSEESILKSLLISFILYIWFFQRFKHKYPHSFASLSQYSFSGQCSQSGFERLHQFFPTITIWA